MNWYCDGWCQEACKDGWSLTWGWDQDAAAEGRWDDASYPVCEKCMVEDGAADHKKSYFVWSMETNERICAVGEAVHKEPAPDATQTNDWGSWCEWPAQKDWSDPNGECYHPSCPHTGFDPQWGQEADTQEYVQMCLDQQPAKDLGCPPGMSTMEVWEETDTVNQWGWNEWAPVKYCVNTRPMKSLKTPRDDLHKVFHYFDWIVKEEEASEAPITDFPEEALTEDFDTTADEWVEKVEDAHVYDSPEDEKLTNAAGFDMPASWENSHEFEDIASWEEEHHDLDPNTMEEHGDGSGSGWYYDNTAFEEDAGTLSPMEDAYHYEGSGSGYYEGSADHYEGSGSGSGYYFYDASEMPATDYYYQGSGSGSGYYETADYYGEGSGSGDFYELASTSEMPATDYHYGSGSGSGYHHKRKHNRHH